MRHHSILCRVCNLLKRAKTYRKTHRAYVDDHITHVGDPECYVDDPFVNVDDPDTNIHINNTVRCEGDPQSYDNDSIASVGDPITSYGQNNIAKAVKPDFVIKYPICPHCSTCTCPRGDYQERTKDLNLIAPFKKPIVPCLLELPLLVPLKYRNNPPNLKLRSRKRRQRFRKPKTVSIRQ